MESYSLQAVWAGFSYSGDVRRPGQEDPLIALVVGGVQPVEDVAGHVVLQEGQHQGIILGVPLLRCFPGSVHRQLLWKADVCEEKGQQCRGCVDILMSASKVVWEDTKG